MRCSLLVLLGLLIYGQTFQFGFVFDDYSFIVFNPNIRDFGHVPLIWHALPMTRSIGFYSFALNYFFNQLAPRGYHIFNFMVHLIAVGLVWALADVLLKITKWLPSKDPFTREIPFIIAVFFLVHPCQTQAVSYISQRFESMATVFYLGTVYCYLCARLSTKRMQKIILFGLSCLLTVLGIFTKEVVITVPAMLLACEWILFSKNNNKKPYIALFVSGVLLYLLSSKLLHMGLKVFLHTIPSQSHDGDMLTPAGYFLTQMRVFLTFLRLLVLPVHQNLDYDYPASTGLLHPPLTLVGIGVVSCFIILIFNLRRKVPLMAFGLAWMLITFSINLAPRSNVIFEHKLYLISFGFFLTTVVLLTMTVNNRRILVLLFLCMITVLSFLSFQRNKVWKNGITLWNDTVQRSPHKTRPYKNRGYFYYHQGDVTLSIADYQKAIELNPGDGEAYNNIGWAYYNQGEMSQALFYYNKSIAKEPVFAEVYYNRAMVYCNQGEYALAISDFNKAIAIDPNESGIYYNRGLAYYDQGNISQAIADYNEAIEIDPGDAEVYNNRGLAYYSQGKMSQAFFDYNKAIELNPELAKAYYNRAQVYYNQGKMSQAISEYNKAIELNPKDADAYNNRAVSYYNLKQYDKAWEDIRTIESLGHAVNPVFISKFKSKDSE